MADIVYRPMIPEDEKEVRELYYEFWRTEPLAVALGIEVPRECEAYVNIALSEALHNKVSVAAVDTKSGKIIGINICVVATPQNPLEWIFPEDDPDCSKLNKDDEVLQHLAITSNYFKHYGVEKIIQSRGMTVDKEYTRKGIGFKMFEKSLEIARNLDVRLAVVDCTSAYSRGIFDKLGFQKVNQINLLDHKDDGPLIIPDDSPHKLGTLHIMKL